MHRLHRAAAFRQAQLAWRLVRPTPPARFASRYAYRPNGEEIKYQRVRLVPEWLTWSRTGKIVIGCAGYALFSDRLAEAATQLLGEADVEDVENHVSDGAEGEEGDLDDDDPLFIPLTWAIQLPRTYYKGSDPEWQAFGKIARDKELRKKISDELAQVVGKYAANAPGLSARLGPPVRIGKYWLETTFPDGPPQDYERKGIAIGDGYIAWASQTIDAEEQSRLMRLLRPHATIGSTLITIETLLGVQYRRVKQALGLEAPDPRSPEEKFRLALDILQRQDEARRGKPMDKPQPGGGTGGGAVASTSTENGSARSPWQLPGSLISSSAEAGGPIDGPLAYFTFNKELRKQLGQGFKEPPRGTFLLSGLVEVIGSRGRIIFDVSSCYDPAKSKFVIVQARVKVVKPKTQSARGGP